MTPEKPRHAGAWVSVPREWLEELAYFRVKEIRGSNDVPAFDLCVKSELNLMLAASPAGTQEGEAEIVTQLRQSADPDFYPWSPYADKTRTGSARFPGIVKLAEIPIATKELLGKAADLLASHARTIEALRAALTTAHEAIELAVCLANEAANEWDAAPNGMKAGKILLALAGHRQGYSDKADKVNAALDICARALKAHPNG